MEPTNFFWKLLARELEEKQLSYRLVNAYTVKKHREGDQLDRSKDDRRDAVQIGSQSFLATAKLPKPNFKRVSMRICVSMPPCTTN